MTMRSRKTALWAVTLLSCALAPIHSEIALAQEFKIEKAVYSDKSKSPVAQNVTLFQGDLVVDLKVDFASPPNVLETKIYDSRQRLVVLLDHQRKLRLEISENRLLQMVDGLRRDISQKQALKFFVEESFKESQELSISQFRLESPTIKYRVKGQRPSDPTYLKMHSEFLDIAARLNASDPGGFPPFARLRLNESIKKMGWIPSDIEIEIQPNTLLTKGLRMRSTHVVIDGLSKDDQGKIANAKNQWLAYPAANLLEFRGIKKMASAKLDTETK